MTPHNAVSYGNFEILKIRSMKENYKTNKFCSLHFFVKINIC
jgi:hypothetical protein